MCFLEATGLDGQRFREVQSLISDDIFNFFATCLLYDA